MSLLAGAVDGSGSLPVYLSRRPWLGPALCTSLESASRLSARLRPSGPEHKHRANGQNMASSFFCLFSCFYYFQ